MVGNGWFLGVVTGAYDYDLKSLTIASFIMTRCKRSEVYMVDAFNNYQ